MSNKNISDKLTFALLGSRLILFLTFQVIIALISSSWQVSEKYWLLSATLTNIVSIVFLFIIFRSEGRNYFSLFKFNKTNFKKDIFIFLGITILTSQSLITPNSEK